MVYVIPTLVIFLQVARANWCEELPYRTEIECQSTACSCHYQTGFSGSCTGGAVNCNLFCLGCQLCGFSNTCHSHTPHSHSPHSHHPHTPHSHTPHTHYPPPPSPPPYPPPPPPPLNCPGAAHGDSVPEERITHYEELPLSSCIAQSQLRYCLCDSGAFTCANWNPNTFLYNDCTSGCGLVRHDQILYDDRRDRFLEENPIAACVVQTQGRGRQCIGIPRGTEGNYGSYGDWCVLVNDVCTTDVLYTAVSCIDAIPHPPPPTPPPPNVPPLPPLPLAQIRRPPHRDFCFDAARQFRQAHRGAALRVRHVTIRRREKVERVFER